MPVYNTRRSDTNPSIWAKMLKALGMSNKATKPDRREYTLMLVPHHGKNIIRIRLPIRMLKLAAASFAVIVIASAGTMISYRHVLNEAQAEKAELEQLRQVNLAQSGQLEELAKSTATLEDDMNRLNRLDADLRKLVNSDEQPASRSGSVRPPGAVGGPTEPVTEGTKPQAAQLISRVNELKSLAKAREQSLTEVRGAIVEKNNRMAATPSIWPSEGEVTSRFGWRWGNDWHPGIDIANDYGTPINATAAGEVVYSGWYYGYGNLIQIDHGNGIVTLYGHCSRLLVSVGDHVKKGDIVANMGSTGFSTGVHVHYEVRVNGTAVNPANFL